MTHVLKLCLVRHHTHTHTHNSLSLSLSLSLSFLSFPLLLSLLHTILAYFLFCYSVLSAQDTTYMHVYRECIIYDTIMQLCAISMLRRDISYIAKGIYNAAVVDIVQFNRMWRCTCILCINIHITILYMYRDLTICIPCTQWRNPVGVPTILWPKSFLSVEVFSLFLSLFSRLSSLLRRLHNQDCQRFLPNFLLAARVIGTCSECWSP